MCYWEEQHWIRTKSIHSAEFFHGMLEIVDRDTPVTVFVGEDAQRSLSERVERNQRGIPWKSVSSGNACCNTAY